ncbi:Platelet-activating factor acetylhydrolase-like [Fusarium oxysporum f. sp. vasinfectum]|nr:Platelet-activating factor acetylhydrolase-like [Fusarium oxysporum f. sp. vasinfectum]
MTDNRRIDPYDPTDGHRQVLASIFWPVDADSCFSDKVSYMPPATAKAYGQEAQKMGLSNDTFKSVEIEVCAVSTSPKNKSRCHAKKKRFPIAIFSSGSGNSRLIYNAMARSIASFGNVVVLIDHPYDAIIVEFPDGTVVEDGNMPEDTESLEKATQAQIFS